MTERPDDRLGAPLVAALASADDLAIRDALRWGLARWRVVQQDLLPRHDVVFAELGRLSAPVCGWVAVARTGDVPSGVLTGAPGVLGALVAGEALRVDGVEAVRRVAAALLEWARPLDGSVGLAEGERPRVRRVLACRRAPRGVPCLERLARLARGTEAEREQTARAVLDGVGELPGRALSPDEALRAAPGLDGGAGTARAPLTPWAGAQIPALEGFVVFERGRVRAAPHGSPSRAEALPITAPLPWGAELAPWDALAPAIAEWRASTDGVVATWNGYRGRVVTLLEVDGAPAFVEVRVERDARTRVRVLPVG